MSAPSPQQASPSLNADQLKAIARRMRKVGLQGLALVLACCGVFAGAGVLYTMGGKAQVFGRLLLGPNLTILSIGLIYLVVRLIELSQQERALLPESERPWSMPTPSRR